MRSATSPRRHLTRLLCALTLAVGLATSMAGAALADAGGGGGIYTDSGGSGNAGGTAGTTPGGGPVQGYSCKNGALWNDATGQLWYDAPYANCTGQNGISFTGNFKNCPTGLLVFRFYGTAANPVQSYSVSRANPPAWCQNDVSYTLFGYNTFDTNPPQVTGSPFWIQKPNNPQGAYLGAPFAAVGVSETGSYVPSRPFAVAGTCVGTQTTPNPLQAYLADPKTDAASKQGTLALLFSEYQTESGNGRYPKTALSLLGLKSITKAPDGTISATFDNTPCGSPMDFISNNNIDNPTTAADKAGQKVTGVCYIGTERQDRIYTNGGQNFDTWPALAKGFGERLDDSWAGSAYTNGNYGSDPTTTAQKAIIGAWRNQMRSWYLGAAGGGLTNAAGQQTLPADPYKLAGGKPSINAQPVNTALAAQVLQADSRCRMSPRVQFSTSPTSPTGPGGPPADQAPTGVSMTVTEHNTPIFQDGGIVRVQQVSVTHSGLSCAGTCPPSLQLVSLSYGLSMTGQGGYRQCLGSNTFNCDYQIVSQTPRAGANQIQPDTTLRADFFHPTMPTQNVNVAVTGLTATYSWIQTIAGLTITGVDPITGKPFTYRAADQKIVHLVSFTPMLTGTPVPLSAGVYTAPVIGATIIATR